MFKKLIIVMVKPSKINKVFVILFGGFLADICLDQYAAGSALVAIGISTDPMGWGILAGLALSAAIALA
ncbi:MAG: hypothetical protein QXN75_05980 [Thermoproteota archaeon]|nr:hypothetical protein [Candidatus Brockarchaeota archaeon]